MHWYYKGSTTNTSTTTKTTANTNTTTYLEFNGELIQGKLDKGGAIVFVLDMAVTDDENRQVQEGVW